VEEFVEVGAEGVGFGLYLLVCVEDLKDALHFFEAGVADCVEFSALCF